MDHIQAVEVFQCLDNLCRIEAGHLLTKSPKFSQRCKKYTVSRGITPIRIYSREVLFYEVQIAIVFEVEV